MEEFSIVHTAQQLEESLFSVRVGEREATRAELLGEWGPLHRFGVVCHEPYGAIGASFLLQMAITAFYDARPSRRSREQPVYPDVFVFHVGGRFGDFAHYDVYGPRKEVFVEDDPAAVLAAVNDRGITHLAVPDRAPEIVQHQWKEPAQATDRIVAAWAYAPSGRVDQADVFISASSPRAEANTKTTLGEGLSYHERQQQRAALGAISVPPMEFLVLPGPRDHEVSADQRARIWKARGELDGSEGRRETYRRIATRDAIHMLHRGAAPETRAQGSVYEITN